MKEDYISISTLNDFFFCPYSIYLHNVYMETDEGLYHAMPQTRGQNAHETIDIKKASNKADVLQSFPIFSEKYKLMGKIDLYRGKDKKLIERKYQLKNIYQGQIYQLWAQYLCMIEMGYDVKEIAFYEVSTNKMIPIDLPNAKQIEQFQTFLKIYQTYNPEQPIPVNSNKCRHCIYCSLCDKASEENVYQ